MSQLERLYHRVRDHELTYPSELIGRTQQLVQAAAMGEHVTGPDGFELATARVRLADGSTSDMYQRAIEFVMTWQMHREAGLRVYAPGGPASVGDVVASSFGVGPLRVAAPCRIVWASNDPTATSAGFGYGTLPGHPECGEEAFAVQRVDNAIWLTIVAFSRPARWFTKVATPAGRLVQQHITNRYIAGVRALANT